ncbi:MAG TPA: hypothetical protein VEQ12_10495 [Candidatus Limnocylindria bacterium]|nr:hypothetical protein [Candidatus Limnocylindria bacterium]
MKRQVKSGQLLAAGEIEPARNPIQRLTQLVEMRPRERPFV